MGSCFPGALLALGRPRLGLTPTEVTDPVDSTVTVFDDKEGLPRFDLGKDQSNN